MSPEAYYAQLGYVRGPHEGHLHFRWRAEAWTYLVMEDPKPLRERLYRMWCWRTGHERPNPWAAQSFRESFGPTMEAVTQALGRAGIDIPLPNL